MRLVKGMLVVLAVALTVSAQANAQGFSGPYAPTNWTTVNVNSNGNVNTGGAPNSIFITGTDGNGGGAGSITYQIASVYTGAISFDWLFDGEVVSGGSGPGFDPFSFVINGVPTQLTNNGGTEVQSGSASFLVNAGDVIGFRINSTDNIVGPGTVLISNFVATPEPATMAIFGLMGLVGAGAALRRRNKAAV